jgi:hypothetical protein
VMENLLKPFHRDRRGNLLAISAVFVAALVMVLTVVINLAHVTHEKIKAQNAADAAALAGGVWQVRGLAFIQGMNNLVYMSDMLASFGLNVGVAGALCSGTGIGHAIGEGGLLVCMGAHGFSQFVLVPLRDLMNGAWPAVSAMGGSSMAHANGARSVITSFDDMLKGLVRESVERKSGMSVDMSQFDNNPLAKAGNWVWELIRQLDFYAVGVEVDVSPETVEALGGISYFIQAMEEQQLQWDEALASGAALAGKGLEFPNVGLVNLHLERKDVGPTDWPLAIPDSIIDAQLKFCSHLAMCHVAKGYFTLSAKTQSAVDGTYNAMQKAAKWVAHPQQTLTESVQDEATKEAKNYAQNEVKDAIKSTLSKEAQKNLDDLIKDYSSIKTTFTKCTYWKHPFYQAAEGLEESANGRRVILPPSTWFAGSGVSKSAYADRTRLWKNILRGLGVPDGRGGYGQLGSLAFSSIQIQADKVGMHPKSIRGWVNLVPVHFVKGAKNSTALGICH